MWMMVLPEQIYAICLRIVMFILRKSVRIVSLSFIVVVGVLQILTISMGILTMHMTSAVTYREKELSVLLK